MAVKEILIWPDPRLLKPSEPVKKIDDTVKALVSDLLATMRDEPMAGLAAPQIGVNKRVFVVDIAPEDNEGNGTNGPEAFINPEFILKEGQFTWEEGCMSIPDIRGPVTRAKKVRMKYLDLEGAERVVDAHGYFAGCLQHENDHLNGILWVDYQSKLRRNIIRKKMLKFMSVNSEQN